jgi:hypothetical protein
VHEQISDINLTADGATTLRAYVHQKASLLPDVSLAKTALQLHVLVCAQQVGASPTGRTMLQVVQCNTKFEVALNTCLWCSSVTPSAQKRPADVPLRATSRWLSYLKTSNRQQRLSTMPSSKRIVTIILVTQEEHTMLVHIVSTI